MSSPTPLWRQAFDAAERTVTPRLERLVRTPGFMTGAALVGRVRSLARGTVQGATARAWHLVNLPAGSDVARLRAQIGALDREVRRLGLQLEADRQAERRRAAAGTADRPPTSEERHADGPQSADDPRPRPARRRTQRPARP